MFRMLSCAVSATLCQACLLCPVGQVHNPEAPPPLLLRSVCVMMYVQCCLSLQGSDRTLQYAAFFTDCEHELSPVSSGMRQVLVYNLVWAGPPGEAPKLYKRSPAEVQLARALKAWEAELEDADGDAQGRMAVLLGAWGARRVLCSAWHMGVQLRL